MIPLRNSILCGLISLTAVVVAAESPAPLTREAIWADPTAETVFTERFDKADAPGLTIIHTPNPVVHASGVVPDGGLDGSGCYRLDVELPAGGRMQVAMNMPEVDPLGLYYRFLLKVEHDLEVPEEGSFPLRMELNKAHPPVHTIYHSEPLEVPLVRDGAWMERTTTHVWRGHSEYVHTGWTLYEGNTAPFFRGRYDRRKDGEPFGMIVWMHLMNGTDQSMRLRISLDDVTVIRRDIYNLPEMKALLETPRPVIQQTRPQILRARERVSNGAAMPTHLAADLRLADKVLTEEIVVPRQQSGWPGAHHCEAEGCDGRLAPTPPDGYTCPKCGKLHTGEKYDKLLVQLRHTRNGEAARALGFAWQWTDDVRYARKAEQLLLAYAESISEFKLGHNWLGDCWLMEDFIFGFDYIHAQLSDESRRKIGNDLLMHLVKRIYHYNHHYPEGYIRLMRVAVWSAMLAEDREWLHYMAFSHNGNREVTFRYGLTDDYVSLKGPAYGGDLVRGFNAIGTTFENCGVTFFDDRARKIYAAIPRQCFPDGSLPAFGHTNVGYGAPAYGIETAYRYYRDPLFLSLTSEKFRQDPSTRLFWDDVDLPPAEPLRQGSTHLAALGITLLRNEAGSTLALSWGSPQRNDPARFDFQFHGAGGHLLWGAGVVGYANPLFESWYQKSISRNGLIVDEQTQLPKAGSIVQLDLDSDLQIVAAELKDAFPDTRWIRAAILLPHGEGVIIDHLTSPSPRTIDWVCQLPGSVTTSAGVVETTSPFGNENGYQLLQNIRGHDASQPFAIVVDHGGRGVQVIPAPAPGARFYLADGRTGTSGILSPVGILRREKVAQATFATLLQPYAEAPSAPGRISVSERGITVQSGDRSWLLTLTEKPFSINATPQ